jgi:hypothetical protein
MTRNPLAAWLLSALVVASAPAAANQRGNAVANPDALTQQDFRKRIDAYIALRVEALKGVGPLKQTADPAEIAAGQRALAERITAARSDAKPGDIFTPEISRRFRELLAPQLKGERGRHARAIVTDDAPPAVPFKVNAPYPQGKPFPTVPAAMLVNLPPLPKQVEYRIVDKHLILRDTEANVIVDFTLNAIR